MKDSIVFKGERGVRDGRNAGYRSRNRGFEEIASRRSLVDRLCSSRRE